MKALFTVALLTLIIGNIEAVDIESHQFIDHLRAISAPGKPEIYEDGVIFTASANHQRVGIAFAHENYSKVHWFKRLLVPRDSADLAGRNQRNVNPNIDTGILFHVENIPENLASMDYRLVIDGLWTSDPHNPHSVSSSSGVVQSRVALPPPRVSPQQTPGRTASGDYRFIFRSAPGQNITVGGSFNNWDPFMYELIETSGGFYTLTLPLPPGSFQYVFFHRGERIADPANPVRRYSRDGRIVSEAQ